MLTRSRLYLIAQATGWSAYILITAAVFFVSGREMSLQLIAGMYVVFFMGIVFSDIYRSFIIKSGWLELDIVRLIPRVIAACIAIAVLFHLLYLAVNRLLFGPEIGFSFLDPNLFTWAMLFFIWSLIYFVYHFFQNFRKEEIKNLKLETAQKEYELRRLKNQMNPHFIFNAMNTIRALVDENPEKAKRAITQLSNVLRTSLQTGQRKMIPLSEEVKLVKDYLEIEKARYEERLQVIFEIDESTHPVLVPPLMLQTLVENGIKHGIAKLPEGGTMEIKSAVKDDMMLLDVYNPGQFTPSIDNDGHLGLENTRQRLMLAYGPSAKLNIDNQSNERVRTRLIIPTQNLISP